MPKRLVPSCGRSPRPSRRLRFISPPSGPSRCTTPNSFVSTPVVATIDLLDNHIDASVYSYTQLQWLLSHHIQRYETRLDLSTVLNIFRFHFYITYLFIKIIE